MQTTYYTTGNFIRHAGNVVDLNEYRRRLAQVDETPALPEEPMCAQSSVQRPRRKRRLCLSGLFDACASLAIIGMTVTVVVQFVLL